MLTLIIILVQAVTVFVGFISASHKLTDPTGWGIIKLTGAGITVAICCLILIGLPVFQNYISNNIQKQEQDYRDSAMRASYDSSISKMRTDYEKGNTRTLTVVTDILAKYGFKLDSTNMILTSFRDSARVNIVQTASPVLCMLPRSFGSGIELKRTGITTYEVTLSLISLENGSSFFKIKCDIVVENEQGQLSHLPMQNNRETIPYRRQLPTDGVYPIHYNISTSIDFKLLYIWVRGSYKRTDGSSNYTVDDVYFYNNLNATSGFILGDTRKNIIGLVNRSGK